MVDGWPIGALKDRWSVPGHGLGTLYSFLSLLPAYTDHQLMDAILNVPKQPGLASDMLKELQAQVRGDVYNRDHVKCAPGPCFGVSSLR